MKNTRVIGVTIIIILLAVLVLGSVGMMGFGGFGMGPGMMGRYGGYGNMMGGFGFGGMLFGGLLMVLFWALVVGGAIWLVVTLARGGQNATSAPTTAVTPLGGQSVIDIVKTRYAKGEITKEQFEEIKRDLSE